MASDYSVEWYNDDGTPTWDTVTTHRFRIDKKNTADLDNPIPIPTSGTNRSHWANFRLAWTAPDSQVDNIRLYSDGTLSWGDGIQVSIGNTSVSTGSVESDPATDGQVGTILTNHSSISSIEDMFSYTSGSPYLVDENAYTDAGSSKHVVMDIEVNNNATQGLKSSETLVWLSDEI